MIFQSAAGEAIAQWFAGLLPVLYVLLGAIFANFILGVTVAVFIRHDFKLEKLSDFVKEYSPKLIAWFVLELLSLIPTEDVLGGIPDLGIDFTIVITVFTVAKWGVYGVTLTSAGASIWGHLIALGLLPGIMGELGARMGVQSSAEKGKIIGDGRPQVDQHIL